MGLPVTYPWYLLRTSVNIFISHLSLVLFYILSSLWNRKIIMRFLLREVNSDWWGLFLEPSLWKLTPLPLLQSLWLIVCKSLLHHTLICVSSISASHSECQILKQAKNSPEKNAYFSSVEFTYIRTRELFGLNSITEASFLFCGLSGHSFWTALLHWLCTCNICHGICLQSRSTS